jgi:hypothetical protein
LSAEREAGMLMLRMPDMLREMESKTDMIFIAKPVWRKRVLNFFRGVTSAKLVGKMKRSGENMGKERIKEKKNVP